MAPPVEAILEVKLEFSTITKPILQLVYDELVKLFTSLGLPINLSKCAIMTVNDDTVLTGSFTNVQRVNKFKYLVKLLERNNLSDYKFILNNNIK